MLGINLKKMKVKGLLTRRDELSFIPSFEEDKKLLSKVKIGDQVAFNLDDTRNLRHHRKYFKMLNTVIYLMPENYSQYNTPERILTEIKDILDMYDEYEDINGNQKKVFQSISFVKMGQKRFEELYNQSCDIILQTFLKHITLQQFNNYLQGLM